MPNFKEFIKGFEEKPEAEQPKEQPKPKENRDQIIEKVNQKMMNANTYGALGDKENYEKSIAEAEELRKGLAPNPQSKGGYFKPLSKEEKKTATEKGLTDDEYRYKQAQDWAILMNEPIPEKNEFMKGLEEKRKAQQAQPKEDFSGLSDYEINASIAAYQKEGIPANEKDKYEALLEEKEARFQKSKQEQEKPKAKYEGGFAKDLQDAGFEPYEVDEEKQILRVKDARGADYEISQGRGYSYNVYKDGKKIYENVPNYMRFDTVVAGKPEAGFERFQVQDDSDISAPAAQPKQGNFQEAFGGEQEEQEQNERAELFQKYLDMGYNKGDAQVKVQDALIRRENAKKEEEFEQLASVGRAFADNGKITIHTPWTKNWRNNHKNYLELRSYLNETYGEGNYAIDYLQDQTRDNGRETSARLEVRLY